MIKKIKQAGYHIFETKEWVNKYKNKKMINVDDAITEIKKGKKVGNKYFSYESFFIYENNLVCQVEGTKPDKVNGIIQSKNTDNFWFVF